MSWFSSRAPDEVLASRIERLIRHAPRDQETAYTFDRLRTETNADSVAALTLAIQRLVTVGKLKPIFRVESPHSHRWIRDFESAEELPREIPDPVSGEVVEVTPRNTRVLFGVPKR